MKTNDETEETGKKRLTRWLIGFLIWTVLGITYGLRSGFTYYQEGLNPPWEQILSSSMTDFYLWGAASPFIFYLSRRFPIERERLFPRLGFYFLIGLVLTFVILFFSIIIYWNIGFANKERFPTLGVMFSKSIFSLYLIHQFTLNYWVTVIAAQAFEYYRQLRAGKLHAAELSSQLAQAELAALKMQVHPHFLFNTLNSIASLLHKDVEAAHKMIARLSDFLRMTLRSSNEPIISLAQEVEFLKTYLEIEKVRFRERLSVEIDVEPDTLKARVPNLILQPLIENAVRHGLAQQASVGRLSVSAKRLRDRLEIRIKDNGQGLRFKGNPKQKNQTGLGLVNTRARLAQIYDDDFYFEIKDDEEATGTIVTLNVPYFVQADGKIR